MSSQDTGRVGRGNPADAPAVDPVQRLLRRRRQIAHLWSVEDVLSIRPDLNADQAWAVLQLIDDQKDASLGITWETIEAASETLYPAEGGPS